MTKHLLLAAALALTLTACASEPTTSSSSSAAVAEADSGIALAHGEADVAFIQGMTPHHVGAVEMADLADERAGDPRVRALAERIRDAQAPELERMEQMAQAWEVDLDGGGHGGGHGGGQAHGEDDAAALEPLSGAAFDREFLVRMVAHHRSALPMARAVLADGENPQAKELARAILQVQEAEIVEMERLLAQL